MQRSEVGLGRPTLETVAGLLLAAICLWPTAAPAQDGSPPAAWLAEMSSQAEIPGLRIGWTANDAMATYQRGVDLERPVVLFFHADNCEFCDRMLQKFSCPTLSRYAGRLAFGFTEGVTGHDKVGDGLAKAVDVERYPTIVVLMPEPNALHVIGRMVGEFDVDSIAKVIDTALNSEPLVEKFGNPEALPRVAETAAKMEAQAITPIDPALCGSVGSQ